MLETENNATEEEKNTPPAPQADDKNKKPDADKGGKGSENEPMIPKHRLDEEAAKRKDAEDRATRAEASAKEALASSKATEDKLSNLAAALQGGDITQKQADKEVAALAEKYSVPVDFVNDMLAAAEARAAKKFEPTLKAANLSQAESAFARELQALTDEYPEIEDLEPADRDELKKRAFSKEFSQTPLKAIYRDLVFDKPRGKSKTVESGRGGGRSNSEPKAKTASDFDTSTPEGLKAFEEWSDTMGKKAA